MTPPCRLDPASNSFCLACQRLGEGDQRALPWSYYNKQSRRALSPSHHGLHIHIVVYFLLLCRANFIQSLLLSSWPSIIVMDNCSCVLTFYLPPDLNPYIKHQLQSNIKHYLKQHEDNVYIIYTAVKICKNWIESNNFMHTAYSRLYVCLTSPIMVASPFSAEHKSFYPGVLQFLHLVYAPTVYISLSHPCPGSS